jgi:hypothetical protein
VFSPYQSISPFYFEQYCIKALQNVENAKQIQTGGVAKCSIVTALNFSFFNCRNFLCNAPVYWTVLGHILTAVFI